MHMSGNASTVSAEGSKKRFFSGVSILSAATLISKVIGLFYRIPLVSVIGIGGMAYFLAANHIYITLYLIFASGLPAAISVLVSEKRALQDHNGAVGVYRTALSLFLLFGLLGSATLFFFADEIAVRIGLAGAGDSIRVIAPTLLFASIASAIRGYFQGCERMLPTAVSEVIEAVSKLIFGLLGAKYAISRGYPRSVASAFAVLGVTVGVFLSMLYLVLARTFALQREKSCRGAIEKRHLSALLRIAAPMTFSSVLLSLTSLVDTALIPRRLLSAGFSAEEAEIAYSGYGNLALPLFHLPTSLITPISLSLVPLLASARRAGRHHDEESVTRAALRLTALLALPASMGLAVFSLPILRLLYPREQAVELAAPLLTVLAVSVLLSALITVTNAMLTAYGHPGYTTVAMLLGAAVKVLAEYQLVGLPACNIFGAPISSFLCQFTVCAVNFCAIFRYSASAKGIFSVLFRPFLAALPPIMASAGIYFLLRQTPLLPPVCTLSSMLAAAIGYLFLAGRCGAIYPSDLDAIPLPRFVHGLLFAREKRAVHRSIENTTGRRSL